MSTSRRAGLSSRVQMRSEAGVLPRRERVRELSGRAGAVGAVGWEMDGRAHVRSLTPRRGMAPPRPALCPPEPLTGASSARAGRTGRAPRAGPADGAGRPPAAGAADEPTARPRPPADL